MAATAPALYDPPGRTGPIGIDPVSLPRAFPAWPAALLSIPIVLRAAVFGVSLVAQSWSADPNRIIPAWAQILQSALMASLAFVLLYYGRADRRSWALGLFVLDSAATLLQPFVRAIEHPAAIVDIAQHLRTDAFQAALVWFFATVFPTPSARPRLAAVFFAGTFAAFALGVVLVAADAYAVRSAPAAALAPMARALARGPSNWYFTLQFLLLTPLVAAMPLKLRELGPDDRRRCMWLAAGIAVGFLPLVLNTILTTVWPWIGGGAPLPYLRLRGAIIIVALTIVPVSGAYAALVQRTLDVRLVIRTALQYLLARGFIFAVAAAPFVGLVALVAFNRDRSVAELVSGGFGIALAALAAFGSAAVLMRRRLLTALDERFLREPVDARAVLVSVANAAREASSIDAFRDLLIEALDAAFHPAVVVTAIAGADDNLHAIDADLSPVPRSSALALLLAGSDAPFDVDAKAATVVQRLAAADRDWLKVARARLIVPLRGSTSALLGVVALGEKRNELPYTAEDRSLLSALGTACGLALDRILAAARDADQGGAAALADPAGRECVDCGLIHEADAAVCSCGGLLQRAPVPRLWNDRLRFDQRIGSGGMGVVYRATDLRLEQLRAVKVLPAVDPALVARFRREARAMAAAKHHNLATLHGLESWRGAPMLVMEYLEGGTLADRLRSGPVPFDDVVAIAIDVSNGLVTLHARGILHRDIKPSNLGFTADGMPKLLDFGLAKLTARSSSSPADASTEVPDTPLASTDGRGIRGTPSYLSPQVLGGAPACEQDDLWSLSVTLLEACTGVNPFRAATAAATVARVINDAPRAAEKAAGLGDEARRLFADLLGPHGARPSSAQEFGDRLRKCR